MEPQPPFAPPQNVPVQPATDCTLEVVCQIVKELSRRLAVVAGQVSDVQAQLAAGDVLAELSQSPISGEGELALPIGTRAVSIDLATLGPDAYTSALGRPRGLMRVGSVRWGSATGYSLRRFIDGDAWVEPRPANVTTLSWQLLEGTAGTLRFLG